MGSCVCEQEAGVYLRWRGVSVHPGLRDNRIELIQTDPALIRRCNYAKPV